MENSNLVKTDQQPNNPLDRAIITNDDGVIFSSRCHLCKSPFRNQVESMFDAKNPTNVIVKFLKDNGVEMQAWRVENHLKKHYMNLHQQAAIAELRDRIGDCMKIRRDMVEDAIARVEILWMELAEALVIDTGNDIDKKLKKTRIVCDLEDQIDKKWIFIKSLHDSEAKARALEERFEKIWTVMLENAKTDEQKKVLLSTLKEFQSKRNEIG